MRRWIGRAVAVAMLVCAAGAGAQDDPDPPVRVRADAVAYERGRGVYVAQGNVDIEQRGRRLTADWVSFHPETRKGVAAGHVVITEGGDTLTAEFLHFDMDSLEGVVFDGRLDSRDSQFRLEGEEVRRTGELTYQFRSGMFTTCRCPDPGRDPWRIRAQRADLELEGYGTARNTRFEILGIPVVWVPWMIYPLKTERQTGFLFPELNASARSGGDVGLPFFWAARDELNVIATPRYLWKRGFKQDVELEYVFGENSAGEFFGSVLPDDDEIDSQDPSTPFDSTRWAFDWIHDEWLPGGWRFKVDARAVSDNLYTFDFRDLSAYRSDRYVESRTFLTGGFSELGPLSGLGLVGSVWWADDQQNPEDRDRDQFLLQRLPDLRVSLPAQAWRIAGQPLAASFDVQYAHFWARRDVTETFPEAQVVGDDVFADTGIDAIPNGEERNAAGVIVTLDGRAKFPDGRIVSGTNLPVDGSRDDFPPGPEGDGRFQEGEPLVDRGHRLVMNPRLGLPFRLGDWLELYPELGYHGTFYTTDAQSLQGRNLFTAQLDARTRLEREFSLPFGGGRARHLLEPRLGYTVLSSASQSDRPLFVPAPQVAQERVRQLDLFNVTRDPADRLESVHAVTLGLGNRVYARAGDGGFARLFADVSVSGQYRLNDDRFGAVYLDGSVFPTRRWTAHFGFGYDLDASRVAEGSLQVAWHSEAGHDLSVSYRYLRDTPRFFESFRFDEERFEEFEEGLVRIDQVFVSARWAITPRWALTYAGRYSFEQSLTLTNRGGIEYISRCRCWALRLEVEDDRSRGIEFNLAYRVMGLGDDRETARPFAGRRGLLDSDGSL